MDFLSTKALTIAVGISISLSITSAILFTLNQITQVYQDVYNVDVSIKKQFNDFSMYDNTIMTGLEMYNTANKFKNSTAVNVRSNLSGASNINTTYWLTYTYDEDDANYTSKRYQVTYTSDINGIITIFFDGRSIT